MNMPKLAEIPIWLSRVPNWVKATIKTGRWKYFFSGLFLGGIILLLISPGTSSASFWTLLGVILSVLGGGIFFYLQDAWKEFKRQTHLGNLLSSGSSNGEKWTIFVTEYWRDISKGNLYKHDRSTPVRGTNRLMGAGDSSALPYVYGLLMKSGISYSDVSTIKSYLDFEQQWSNNFISVGGLTNKATERLMYDYKDRMPFYFSRGGNGIIKSYGEYEKYLKGDHEHDFGMIMKVSGLNHPDRVLFLVAGIEDLGTSGSAYYLFDRAEELANKYPRRDFALIIAVKRNIGEKSAFEVDFDEKSIYCVT